MIARALTVVALAAVPVVTAAPADAAEPAWNRIIECESGNRNVENDHSSASGYLQFTDGTWKAYGGREFGRRAKHASKAEQLIVANRAYRANGLRDWNASRSCWAGKSSGGGHHRHHHHDDDED